MSPKTYSHPHGVTIVEITVIISIIVCFISALFFSAKYYKDASDRSACITQISQYQKAVRSYQNLNSLSIGDDQLSSELHGLGKPFRNTQQF